VYLFLLHVGCRAQRVKDLGQLLALDELWAEDLWYLLALALLVIPSLLLLLVLVLGRWCWICCRCCPGLF